MHRNTPIKRIQQMRKCKFGEKSLFIYMYQSSKQLKKIQPDPVATPGLLAKRKPKVKDNQIFEMKREIKKK